MGDPNAGVSYCTGTVKSWVEDRGMGFVTPDNGGGHPYALGEDHFVHRSDLTDGNMLVVGSAVTFLPSWDPAKGKPVAKSLTGATSAAGKGAAAAPAGPGNTVGLQITGVVKAWYDEKGMGFIQPDAGGTDCFVHRSFLTDGRMLVVGAQVAFTDGWDNQKQKRVAQNVIGAIGEAKGAGKGQGQPAAPLTYPPATALSVAAPAALAAPVPATGGLALQTGTVEVWHDSLAMGILRPDDGGEFVVVPTTALTGGFSLPAGARVNFLDGVDPLNGKRTTSRCLLQPQLQAMVLRPPPPPPAPLALAVAVPPPPPVAAYVAPGYGAAPSGGLQNGTVKAWIEDRGMGFISPAAGGEDVFVHRSALQDCQALVIGTSVMFEDSWDQLKGKRAAKVVYSASAGAGAPVAAAPAAAPFSVPGQTSGMIAGTVKIWMEDKAFGFIVPDSGEGGDVMIHKNDLPPGLVLAPGMPVLYEAAWDPTKGKFKAFRVQTTTGLETAPFLPSVGAASYDMNALVASPPSQGFSGQGSLHTAMDDFCTPCWPSQGALPAFPPAAPLAATGTLMTGTVKAWLEDRGMGFIKPDGGGDDLFVHRSDLTDGQFLAVGTPVYFEEQFDPVKGKRIAKKLVGASSADSGAGKGAAPAAAPAAAGGNGAPSDNLFVRGMPATMTEEFLQSTFAQYGTVISCKVLPSNGKPDSAGLVRMADVAMATWIVENLNGNIPVGFPGPIVVRFANASNKGGAKGVGAGGGYGKAGKGGGGAGVGQDRSSPFGAPQAFPGGSGLGFSDAPMQPAPFG